MQLLCGIYRIYNTVNEMVYIGQSVNIHTRFKQHLSRLRHGTHGNQHLQRAWNLYGEDKFTFEIIETCSRDKLNEREIYWIKFYGGINSPSNYNQGPVNGKGGVSDYVKQKLSEANKGQKRTGQALQNIRTGVKRAQENGTFGHKQSPETIEKIKNTLKGRKFSEETKRKMSESAKKIKHGKQSQETISKRVEKLKGKKRSEEFKQKQREYAKKQFKEGNISPLFSGSYASKCLDRTDPEYRKKVSVGLKAYWDKVKSGEIKRDKKNS